MGKALRDAVITLAVEETVRRYSPDLLPYAWFAILCFLTWEGLHISFVKRILGEPYRRLGRQAGTLSYLIVGFIGLCIAIIYWWGIQKTFSVIATREEGFHVVFKTEMVDMRRNSDSSSLRVLYNSGYGATLSPVSLWAFLEITNLYSRPITISSYSFAMRSDACGWVYLSPIDARPVTLLWTGSGLDVAQAISLKRAFSYVWENPIPAYGTQDGFLLFDTRVACDLQVGSEIQFRLELVDSLGKSNSYQSARTALRKNFTSGDSIGQGEIASLDLIGQAIDVSKAFRRIHSDPMPDTIEGVQRGVAPMIPQGKVGRILLQDGAFLWQPAPQPQK